MSDGIASGSQGEAGQPQVVAEEVSRSLAIQDAKLEGNDFLVWRIKMESRFRGAQVYEHVSGPEPQEPTQDWIHVDLKVRDCLIRHLPNSLILEVNRCETAAAVWRMLNELCGHQASTDRCKLKQEWYTIRVKPMEPLLKLRTRGRGLAQRMQLAGCPVSEEDQIHIFLAGLPKDDLHQ